MADQTLASQIALLNLLTPADGAAAITPDDSNDLPTRSRAIYVGVSGHIKMTMVNGDIVTRKNVPVGEWPWRVKRIWATGTTASELIADY